MDNGLADASLETRFTNTQVLITMNLKIYLCYTVISGTTATARILITLEHRRVGKQSLNLSKDDNHLGDLNQT